MARFKKQDLARWQQKFVALLPTILNYALPAFRTLRPEAKAEAIQEVVANAFVAFARLMRQGREALIFPTVLAAFAIKQVRAGRRVGGRLNSNDVSSPYAQRRRQLRLGRLDRYVPQEACWQEVLIEDDRTPILDQVCFRIDFPAWLDSLSSRDREIAEALADGGSTSEVADRFGITLGRVSQFRRKFEKSWLEFHGEEEKERMEPLAAA